MIVGQNDNSPVSHCSKCEAEQGDGTTRSGDQDQAARTSSRGKGERRSSCFLAEELKIPKRNIVLERGQQSRDKLIRIEGFSEEDVRCRLGTLIK